MCIFDLSLSPHWMDAHKKRKSNNIHMKGTKKKPSLESCVNYGISGRDLKTAIFVCTQQNGYGKYNGCICYLTG